MNTHFPGLNSFDRRALELDVDYTFAWIKSSPSVFIEELLDRIKFCARNLKKVAGIQQTKALEALAESLSFSTWHELLNHLNMANSFGSEGANDQWILKLQTALVLTIKAKPCLPLGLEQAAAMQSFASNLAEASGQTEQLVLDGVTAKLCGALTWEEVLTRSPLQTKSPLYRFVVDSHDPNDSRFVTSDACDELIEQMYELHPDFEVVSDQDRVSILAWLQNALKLQPQFFEGGLMLASLLDEVGDPSALTIAEKYLGLANALVPKGFRKKILWAWQSNRFYHRLQYLVLDILNRDGTTVGDLNRAIKVAKKMLRLNPSDNLGIRYLLPLLLLQMGWSDDALSECARFRDEDGGEALLVKSFCAYANGDLNAFRNDLVAALFKVPALRLFLFDELGELPDSDEGFRGIIPDMDSLTRYAWPAYLVTEGLEEACRSVLEDEILIKAEAELRGLWHELPRGPSAERFDAMRKYDNRVAHWKKTLAQHFTG
ncbi:TPA: hypothetical protein NHR53_002241 [Pseudomonas aeruginosa]|uniref:hypothetical protein n=1 Tax=Pseudomonas aeruginosa TaxID=287 RepID=UPI0008033B06|nr:hypothetical protein [Pseudomonas aeruginosa]OBY20733.1 hypothetical protein A8O37_25395 [Pseudomonas aeruginosa]HCE7245692.1 hypothetical protein [Pseudomonas aeruginosa]HCE8125702.1 hypothetical protein [Pseudomonas aeruginosa]HCF0444975.1 hypothetical protein [Pseudomonas aeruginosa]